MKLPNKTKSKHKKRIQKSQPQNKSNFSSKDQVKILIVNLEKIYSSN